MSLSLPLCSLNCPPPSAQLPSSPFLSLPVFLSLGPVFALFVPFFHSIPRVPITQLLGQISITNKSLVYIVGLQVRGCLLLLTQHILMVL